MLCSAHKVNEEMWVNHLQDLTCPISIELNPVIIARITHAVSVGTARAFARGFDGWRGGVPD